MTTILVVDDEFLIADMLAYLLEDEGYAVETAHHGRMALEMVPRVQPELVITDFMMPLMTGLEFAQALKADAKWRDLPVILVSGAQGALAREHPDLFAAVFDKPFRNDLLVQRVQELVGRGR